MTKRTIRVCPALLDVKVETYRVKVNMRQSTALLAAASENVDGLEQVLKGPHSRQRAFGSALAYYKRLEAELTEWRCSGATSPLVLELSFDDYMFFFTLCMTTCMLLKTSPPSSSRIERAINREMYSQLAAFIPEEYKRGTPLETPKRSKLRAVQR